MTGDALKELTGEDIINQKLAYLMRSGAPDALDMMVGFNFSHMAMDLITDKVSGRMVALKDGKYTHVPMNLVTSGIKRVDVEELYDVEEYRPKIQHVLGKPMFLY
jgi:6-phosphofructokinase